MINSNPETVSTDYDTSDLLFFEPLTHEDILNLRRRTGRRSGWPGVIVQFGGQTPLNLAQASTKPACRSSAQPDSLDPAGDREQFRTLLHELNLQQPQNGIARTSRTRSGSPTRSAIRSSSVRASCSAAARWRSSTTTSSLARYIDRATEASTDIPILIDKFLDNADECDVDCLADTTATDRSSSA